MKLKAVKLSFFLVLLELSYTIYGESPRL